ncbi:MAG: cytochrome c oxidase subunit II [Cyanobacteriota bacterium]
MPLAFFLIVQGVLIYCAIRYRKRRGDEKDGDPNHGNVLLEIVWTAVPALVILWLGVASLDVYQAINGGVDVGGHAHSGMAMEASSYEAEAPSYAYRPVVISGGKTDQPDLVVQVQGMQYAWVFTYPESGLVTGELHLPLNKRVRLDMTALDVNHAFWVPQFRLKQDVIPGRETHLEFVPSQLGEYPIVCAELCGPYHGVMAGQLFVDTPEAFASWQKEQILAARSVDSALALAPETQPESAFAKAQQQRLGIPKDLHALHQHFGSQSSS